MSEHVHTSNKKIALLIAVLAALLAFSEILGKNAQTEGLSHNIEASNLWNFFQAKTIRKNLTLTEIRSLEIMKIVAVPAEKDQISKTIEDMQSEVARYESDPTTNEGRQQLSARAKAEEQKRDRAFAAYHLFEYASAAMEIAIVLASAAAITEIMFLVFLSGGLGVAGIGLSLLGVFAPMILH